MKQLVSFLLFIIFVTTASYAQTPVSGGIYNNTTWTLANSPYLMTGAIVVFPGKTLTIEPGVKVLVEADLNATTGVSDTYLEIRGNLVAEGTAAAPIIFTTDSINVGNYVPTYTPYQQWKGIIFKASQGGTGSFNYLTLDHSSYGISDEGFGSSDTLSLTNCTFSNNGISIYMYRHLVFENCNFDNNYYALWGDPTNSVTATNCNFSNNVTAVPYYGAGSNFSKCTFTNNQDAIANSAGGVIDSCTFTFNDYVLSSGSSAMNFTITNCLIENNQIAIGYLGDGSITNCKILNNVLGLGLGNGTVVEDCEIKNNQVGIKVYGQFTPGQLIPNVKDNQICYNTVYNVENATDLNLGLEKNCFCESDSATIEASIYDGYDDITRGLFNYGIYDSTCQNLLYFIQKVNLDPVSIDEQVKNNAFVISPNPMQTEVSVLISPDQVNKETIQVLDLQGKVYYSQRVTAETALISLPNLPSGIYFMKIGNAVQKFIKE
ncbi:MAG: right-handed parallel beta-helix repeat-containing protein [Bacteroidia bacterium]